MTAPSLPHVAVVSDAIDPLALLARVGSPADGAVLLFLGTVREENEGRAVSGMSYEAYEDMARGVLREIAGEVAGDLGHDRIAVVHRVGSLEVGEVSVAIAVSSPHRAEAYEASRYVIEEIKKRLPVWKLEHYLDGERRWLPGSDPRRAGPAPVSAGGGESR